jgi:hypothetical protein
MKKVLYSTLFFLLFLSCHNEEIETIVINLPPSEVDINIVSSIDENNYTVLEEFFIGSHHNSTILTSDGNLVHVGGGKQPYSSEKMALVKTKTNGEILYFKELFQEWYGRALGVLEDSEQNIYVVGYTYTQSGIAYRKLAVAKLDANGNVLWENNYQLSLEDAFGSNVLILPNDEILVSGSQSGNPMFLKINPTGEEVLFSIKESSTFCSTLGMVLLEDGRILLTGSSGEDAKLSWYDTETNLLGEKKYGSMMKISRGLSTIQLRDGNLLLAGRTTSVTSNNIVTGGAVLLLKTDVNGELIWSKTLGDTHHFNIDGQSLRENEDGSFVLYGYDWYDHMLFYLDSEGNEINSKYYRDSLSHKGTNIVKLGNERNVLTGTYQGGTFFLNVDNYGL